VRGAADPRVLDVPRFRECRGRGLAQHAADPIDRQRLRLGELLELEQERGIFIPAQEPEEGPLRQAVGTVVGRKAQLEQAPVLRHGPRFLDPVLHGGRRGEEIGPPDAGLLLALHDGRHPLGLGQLRRLRDDGIDGRGFGRSDLLQGPVTDGLAAVFKEPAEGNAMGRGQLHDASWANGEGGSSGREDSGTV
jgi:hypothetical protein